MGSEKKLATSRFPVYQLDFTAVACGKNVASSKRRIRWRFGFSNREALESGQTGTACRGEEHDVTLIWSVTSGKRLIFSDGQELHYSTNRSSIFEYSWTMRGNHVVKLVAHAAPPLSANPGFRQYDLFVDGLSFFNMPRVFELGIKGDFHAPYPGVINKEERPAPLSDSRVPYDLTRGEYVARAPQTLEEEEADLKMAIQASIAESRAHLQRSVMSKDKETAPLKDPPVETFSSDPNPPIPVQPPIAAPAPENDLLDLMGDLSIVPSGSQQPQTYAYDGINLVNADAPPPSPGFATAPSSYDPFSAPPPQPASQVKSVADPFFAQNSSQLPPQLAPTATDPFSSQRPASYTPSQPPVDPFAAQYASPPPPSFTPNAVRDPFSAPQENATANGNASSTPLMPNVPAPKVDPMSMYSPDTLNYNANNTAPPPTPALSTEPKVSQNAPSVNLSLNTSQLSVSENPFDQNLKKLVNFDDITSPSNAQFSLSMISNPIAEEQKKKDAVNKGPMQSKGLPPPSASFLGPQPSLAEMRSQRPTATKEVLASPSANQNTMVLHAQQNGNYAGYINQTNPYNQGVPSGPPPLQQGFGVGATFQSPGYGQQMYNQYQPQQQQWAPQQGSMGV